jgi:hypothetical protein
MMTKRFIVCHQPGSTAEDEAFNNWLKSEGFYWWHWVQGSWVLIDQSGRFTAPKIRDVLNTHYHQNCNMVFEHGSFDYAGTGSGDDTQREKMGVWLLQYWNP